MALGDFLTLPEDDLALASVLKSPLFGLDDDDLLALAPKRQGFLWQELVARAATDARVGIPADTLKRWRARADLMPPFEFFSALLDADGMRARMLERLGAEAADAIDELLNLALAYDDGAAPSLQGFLSWLREGTRVIKRDTARRSGGPGTSRWSSGSRRARCASSRGTCVAARFMSCSRSTARIRAQRPRRLRRQRQQQPLERVGALSALFSSPDWSPA